MRKEPAKKKLKKDLDDEETETINETSQNYDHDYLCHCPTSADCSCGLQLELKQNINILIQEYDELQEKINNPNTETVKKVDQILKKLMKKTNEKTKLYTGLLTKAAFSDLLRLTCHKVSRMRYWQGDKKAMVSSAHKRSFKKTPVKFGSKRKLTMKEELLIVLMKLHLGLLNLGDMFGISSTSISVIFNTWIKLLAAELCPLVFYPDKIIIREYLPDQLKHYPRQRCTYHRLHRNFHR